jgi:hypothetical protein
MQRFFLNAQSYINEHNFESGYWIELKICSKISKALFPTTLNQRLRMPSNKIHKLLFGFAIFS